MANVRRDLDPSASPLDYYGYELRRRREGAGLTLSELGSTIFCTGSLVGQIECAQKVPTREFSERVDAALGAEGFFSGLVGLVLQSQLPSWFQPFAGMEAKAAYISSFQCQVVYGLLQTEEYARALLSVGHPDEVDEQVAARLERQRILSREAPPPLWVVLSEAVLDQQVGGPAVMRGQLEYLLGFAKNPWVQIQVLPSSVGQHPGLMGSFTLLRFDRDPDLFYADGYDQGHMTANPQVIRERSVSYARLQACALSPEDSAELIGRVMEDRYGHQPGPDRSTVA
ncbi:Scr1 family TA system antitoxin-like transcriptional regulator [Streptomyces sp. NPDC051913]|uniref:helix-turn-helix domain-containing protein n=1 Tax=Streptomyces sp. NPDC051913 TaxID=3365676 RepID=UPI0037D79DC7